MNKLTHTAFAVAAVMMAGQALAADRVTLDGTGLTVEQVVDIADGNTSVKLAKSGMKRAKQGYDVLIESAVQGMGVYGLTVGVGWNKDQPVFGKDGKMSPELIELSKTFNYDLIRAHSAAIGPFMETELVKMAMAVRLNQMLTGHVGVQPEVAQLFAEFLNRDITPLIPSRGSVGTADILPAAHFGLAMIGEWDVMYKGKRVSAKEAMRAEGLKPLQPFGKDALSILSTNALSVAYAIDTANKAEHLLNLSPAVVAYSLEGFNGNVSPYLQQTVATRPMPYVAEVAGKVTAQMDGSYLWQLDGDRALQDPLSFRGSHWALAAAQDELQELKALINIHINSSDDNPTIVIGKKAAKGQQADTPQVEKYYVDGKVKGAVYSASNFEPVQLSLQMQSLGVAMGHVARDSVFRTLKLSDPHFTQLTRFVNSPEATHGFGAIQKTFVSMYSEIKGLINPVSLEGLAVAGYIEDTFSNTMLVGQRMETVLDNLEYIYAVEMMHAAEAVDQRINNQQRQIGKGTAKLHQQFRQVVAPMQGDRAYTNDIEAAKQFVETL